MGWGQTEGTRSSLRATCSPQDVVGLQDLVVPRSPQYSAQGGSCRSGAGSWWMPPPFPVLCHSLRVRARAASTPRPAEAPWEAPGAGDIPGTARRWVLVAVGGGAVGGRPHPGDPGQAHAGVWQGHGTRQGHHVPPRHPEKSRAPRGVPDVTGAGWHQVSDPRPLPAFPTTLTGANDLN